ncbi:MAG: ABC transporter permease subunit [Synergistaceae bacterium]|jgi:NitT/TauT family transport system permease protein|nr:ABC transporter permease subunit [Synergistaceae bacterium]
MIKRFFTLPTILYFILLYVAFTDGVIKTDDSTAFIVVLTGIEMFFIYTEFKYSVRNGSKPKERLLQDSRRDITSIIFAVMLWWELTTKVFGLVSKVLFPPLDNVFYVFVEDYPDMLRGIVNSLYLVFSGVGSGTVAGVVVGLLVGWIPRLRNTVAPIANVVAAIPALIYAPYVVAISPSFKLASIFVIFLGCFWPTLMNMIGNIAGADKKLLDSARSLNLGTVSMLFKVLLPYSVYPIIANLRIRVADAFMVLTFAEMIGSNVGLGFYVKRWSNFAKYNKVFAGIILIGVVVTAINKLIKLFENKFVRWK